MEYVVKNIPIRYEAIGPRQWGKPLCLLDNATDLTANTKWASTGFSIEPLFDESTYSIFRNNTFQLLSELWRKASLTIPSDFNLEQYHTAASTKELHLKGIEFTKLVDVKHFPISIDILEKRISAICQENLVVKNPFDGRSVFHFRVIRPQQNDNNPLHRDVWLEDYDNCINLYIPVAGSNEKSSLVIIPGSHRWLESCIERTTGRAEIGGIKFNVPAITAINTPAEYLRPNPRANEVLVFSPYLIHGGAINLNNDSTRISIEVRLWKR